MQIIQGFCPKSEILHDLYFPLSWDEACPSLTSFCILCRKENGAILEVYMLELNLGKFPYPTPKLENKLQYQFIS